MGILRELFGPSKKELWRSLSEQMGSHFVDGGFFGSDKVLVQYRQWVITLDTYAVSTGKSTATFTRMRAPYINADCFRFSICRSGFFTELVESLGFHDIKVGNEIFDQDFVIKSTCEEKVRALLSDPGIQELIQNQPEFSMKVKDNDGWFNTLPDGVDELYFVVPGVIKDIEQLKQLFDIFSAVLQRLCIIGSAYEDEPGVDLSSDSF